jgi:competence protein ComEC
MKRPFVRAAAVFVLGEAFAAGVSTESALILSIFAICICGYVDLRRKRKDNINNSRMGRNSYLAGFCFLLLFYFAGVLRYGNEISIIRQEEGKIKDLEGKVAVIGRVDRVEEKENSYAYYLDKPVVGDENGVRMNGRILVFLKKEKKENARETIRAGNLVKIKGELKSLEPLGNPGQFDERKYYFAVKVYGKLIAEEIERKDSKCSYILYILEKLKQKLGKNLKMITGEEKAAVYQGILLGDKQGITEEIKELYQKNGIGHIMAISGLHISCLGITAFKGLRKIRLSFVGSASVSSAIVILYVIMTGMSVSSVRAVIMFQIFLLSQCLGRTYDLLTGLSVAAIVILWNSPMYLYHSGFLLSFSAILGIGLIVPEIFRKEEKKAKGMEKVFSSLGVSLAISPILALFYYEIPSYGILLNVLILPFMPVLFFSCLCGAIAGELHIFAGKAVILAGNMVLNYYEFLCKFFLKIPGAVFMTGCPFPGQIAGYYATLWMTLWLCFRKDRRKIAPVLFISLFLLLIRIQERELKIFFMDVGQGDGIVIQSEEGRNYMIDGGSSDINEVFRYRIKPFLKWSRIKKIDYIFITHFDEDHISGIRELIGEGIPVSHVVISAGEYKAGGEIVEKWEERLKENGIKLHVMKKGETFADGALTMKCLYPSCSEDTSSRNDNSLVLLLEYRGFSALFTGDLESAGEENLIKNNLLEKIDLLKVGHHGGKNSTTVSFLEKTDPQVAVISCGRENRYGHPHKEVLNRLKENQTEYLITKESGMIEVRVNDKGEYRMKGFLKEKLLPK